MVTLATSEGSYFRISVREVQLISCNFCPRLSTSKHNRFTTVKCTQCFLFRMSPPLHLHSLSTLPATRITEPEGCVQESLLGASNQPDKSRPVSYRGAALTMLSTLTIISAASAADVRTCFLTWYDSVTPISTMSPIRP